MFTRKTGFSKKPVRSVQGRAEDAADGLEGQAGL